MLIIEFRFSLSQPCSYMSSKLSVSLEPETTSPTVEEDSMELGDTVNQEEGTRVDPGSRRSSKLINSLSYMYNSFFFHSPSSSYEKHAWRRFTVGTFRISTW